MTLETPIKREKRSYNVKPRATHVIALEKILESKGKNIKKALREALYSISIQNNPKSVLETKGFKQLLYSRGLSESFVTDALVEDIKGKPRKRVEELKLAANILRMTGTNTPPSDFKPTQINIGIVNIERDTREEPTHREAREIPTPEREHDRTAMSSEG